MFIIIGVDDFKISGPEKTIQQGWALLRKGLAIEPEARVGDKDLAYIGCAQMRFTLMFGSGRMPLSCLMETNYVGN